MNRKMTLQKKNEYLQGVIEAYSMEDVEMKNIRKTAIFLKMREKALKGFWSRHDL